MKYIFLTVANVVRRNSRRRPTGSMKEERTKKWRSKKGGRCPFSDWGWWGFLLLPPPVIHHDRQHIQTLWLTREREREKEYGGDGDEACLFVFFFPFFGRFFLLIRTVGVYKGFPTGDKEPSQKFSTQREPRIKSHGRRLLNCAFTPHHFFFSFVFY